MWPFYPFLNSNSGVTPPYARSPQGSSWPFYTGNGGGAKLPVPYSPKPMTTMPSPGLPATVPEAGLPANLPSPGLPTSIPNYALDLMKRAMAKAPAAASGLEGGLLGRAGGLLGPLGVLLGMTSPAGDANDNGTGALLQQGNKFGDGVSVPDNPFGMGTPPVPMPRPRPIGPPMSLAAPTAPATASAPPGNFYNGPGSMSFGATDAAPGQAGSMQQTGLLEMLLKNLSNSGAFNK